MMSNDVILFPGGESIWKVIFELMIQQVSGLIGDRRENEIPRRNIEMRANVRRGIPV